MYLVVAILILGASLLGYSFTLSRYKDEALFYTKYEEMTFGQSNEYFKLRDEMLTPKFQLEDYGISLLLIAFIIFVLYYKKNMQISVPNSRYWLIALGISLPFITVAGYVYDLLNAQSRGEFPHWGDSMGIPLMGVPVLLISLIFWVVSHFGFLSGEYQPSVKIELKRFYKTNIWLKFVSVIATLMTVLCFSQGLYWYAIPSLAWVYFYFSLATVGVVKQK